jgi:ABC-type branched-subunit amino acid transport system permease subunit
MTRRALGLCAIACVVVPWSPLSEYAITLLIYIGLASLVTIGLTLLTGIGGLTSFGQAAFVGIGAYTAAYFTTTLELSPWLALLVALLLTAACAWAIGAITVRMSGHFLPLATIAWGLSLYYLFGNLEFLGKYDGLSGLPMLSLFGLRIGEQRPMCALIWLVLLLSAAGLLQLLDSRPGRAIRALPQASLMAEAMGVHTARTKRVIFVIAALLAALSGWLYAFVQRAVSPSPFALNHGIEYLFMGVLGGLGHVGGGVLGAVVVTLLREVAQHALPETLNTGGSVELMVYGGLLVFFLQRAPQGVWPVIARRFVRRSERQLETQGTAVSPGVPSAPAELLAQRPESPSARPDLPLSAAVVPAGATALSELLAVRSARTRRGRGRQPRGECGRDRRPDRPEWRRQVDDVQPDHGRAAADGGGSHLAWRAALGLVAAADRRARRGADLPARPARADHERARQRRDWRAPARRLRAGWRRASQPTRA